MKENCDRCGKPVLPETLTYIQVKNFKVCQKCVREYYVMCDECGQHFFYYDTIYSLSGKTVCLWCLCEKYIFCVHCRDFIKKEDAVEFHGHLLCRKCVDMYYESCSYCKKQAEKDELIVVLNGEKIDSVCRECLQKHFVQCSKCGEFVEASSAYTYKNKKYCRYCKEIVDLC